LYTHLATCFGWTFEHIGQTMTLPRLRGMVRYWKDHPPLHVLAAAYVLGADKGKGKAAAAQPNQTGSLKDLMREFGAAGGHITGSTDGNG
jgi:hypothetical protein